MTKRDEVRVFISYGRENASAAMSIFTELKKEGHQPWLDTECLVAGQKWKPAILQAIKNSNFFLLLISSSSVTRRGFINREIKEALEILAEFPEDKPFIIPVRLDNCNSTQLEINELQRVDMFPSWEEGIRQIKKTITIISSKNTSSKDIFNDITVYVLMKGPSGYVRQARDLPCITSWHKLYGPYDFFVVLRGDYPTVSKSLKTIGETPGVTMIANLAAD